MDSLTRFERLTLIKKIDKQIRKDCPDLIPEWERLKNQSDLCANPITKPTIEDLAKERLLRKMSEEFEVKVKDRLRVAQLKLTALIALLVLLILSNLIIVINQLW